MEDEAGPCQSYYRDLIQGTLPDDRSALPLRRIWWDLKKHVWHISILGLPKFVSLVFYTQFTKFGKYALKKKRRSRTKTKGFETLNLQPGDWAEVRSLKEIFSTLDARGKLRGLAFNPEMVKFCGRRFRVYKRLERIIAESTGELRKVRTPTVMLEGVFCDGQAHGGCDRSCFCFWREAWLKRVSEKTNIK